MSGSTSDLMRSIQFIVLAIIAAVVSYAPFASAPFSWFSTFFYEITQGFTAFLTGGDVDQCRFGFGGSGSCSTKGGIQFLVLIIGYTGLTLWGVLLFLMAGNLNDTQAKYSLIAIAALTIITAVLWVRDLNTWLVLAAILLLTILLTKLRDEVMTRLLLKFIGLFMVMRTVMLVENLLKSRHVDAASQLSGITSLPAVFWTSVWFTMGALALFYLWRKSCQTAF